MIRIVVVDDHPVVRAGLRTVLNFAPVRVKGQVQAEWLTRSFERIQRLSR